MANRVSGRYYRVVLFRWRKGRDCIAHRPLHPEGDRSQQPRNRDPSVTGAAALWAVDRTDDLPSLLSKLAFADITIRRRTQSILPEAIEAVGALLGIAHRVHDVAVAEEVLQRARIDAVIG